MEGRDGDAAQADDAADSSSTEPDGPGLSWSWPPTAWLSGKELPEWASWESSSEQQIAVALFTVVLMAGAGGGYFWYQEAQEAHRRAELRKVARKFKTPIYWPSERVTTLNAEFELVTKWLPVDGLSEPVDVDKGKIKYKLRVYGDPEALEKAWRSDSNASYFVTIQLLDTDGFRVRSIKLTLDQLTRTVNPEGEGIGFSVQGSETMSLHTYRRVEDWKITWNL